MEEKEIQKEVKEEQKENNDNEIKINEIDNNKTIKYKKSKLYFYIPLILSGFSYMCHNSLNFMIQVEPNYLIKLNNNLESTKLDKNKTNINNISKALILWILFINILSKSLGYLILNTKFISKKIDILYLISNIISFLINLLFYLKKVEINIIFFSHLFNAFTSGLFFVTLLRLNWSFLPLNEGFVSGIFNSFEYFSIVHLSLFHKFLELKYLFIINAIYCMLSIISIFIIKFKFKGFYLGKSSDLDYNLGQKMEINIDNSLKRKFDKNRK